MKERRVGRRPLPAEARAKNVVFRLRPDVERELDFIVGAGGYKTRVDALEGMVAREAKRLRKDETRAFAGRVAMRADTLPRSASAGGARMDRAERILTAYVCEVADGEVRWNHDAPVWSCTITETGTRIEANDMAISYLASLSVADACEALDMQGVRAATESPTRKYIGLDGGEGWSLSAHDQQPAEFRGSGGSRGGHPGR